MAKITKSLSTKVSKETGKSEIMFRFIVNRSLIIRAKSGIHVNPKQWNEKKGEMKTATFGAVEAITKRKLDELCNVIIDTYTETDNELINKEWLTTVIDKYHYPEKYKLMEEEKQSIFEVFEDYISIRKPVAQRERQMRVVFRALKRFELYNGLNIELDTLTDDIIRQFAEFLKIEYTLQDKRKYKAIYEQVPECREPKERGQNTINSIIIKFRTFYYWCVEMRYTTNNVKFKIDACVYGTPFYITVNERKQIGGADLPEKLAKQRDVFVFHCCVGCRIGDLYKLTMANIVNGAIQYVPRKTKDGNPHTVTVPLNETAKEILDRYKDDEKILPFISEQKYNEAIKKIFEVAGVTRVVQVRNALTGESEPRPINEVASSHLARRTFIGNIYKQVKDPNLVGALSGHKEGSRAFARYRDIDDDMKRELVSLID